MKTCNTCKIEKEANEFYKRKTSKDGLRYRCKTCDKKHNKDYKQANKERLKEYSKEYYKDNKERIIEYGKKHRKENKEYYQEYRQTNKEREKEYYQANKKRINEQKKEWHRQRRQTDPLFKMTCNLRKRTWEAFKNKGYSKNTKTQEMLGVDWEVCKAHIERQFIEGMNWDNQGEWHIDHIIPLASANNEEELMKLCHYSNLQPLWAEKNLEKKDKIIGQQVKFRI